MAVRTHLAHKPTNSCRCCCCCCLLFVVVVVVAVVAVDVVVAVAVAVHQQTAVNDNNGPMSQVINEPS